MGNNERVVYKGEVFAVLNTGRYLCSWNKDKPIRLLHRRIWTETYGPIPEGYDIHHIDGDWRNNSIENLECVPRAEHAKMHMLERLQDENFRVANARNLAKAQEAAKQWHSSEAGREWHSKHGFEVAASLPYLEHECIVCGKRFLSRNPRNPKTCSRKCLDERAKNVCMSACANCGKSFCHPKPRKNHTFQFCGRKCAAFCRGRSRLQPDA